MYHFSLKEFIQPLYLQAYNLNQILKTLGHYFFKYIFLQIYFSVPTSPSSILNIQI